MDTGRADMGLRIARLREHRGWSVRELAQKSGVSHTRLGEIETGKGGAPQQRTLDAIARAFGWPSWESLAATDALDPPSGVGGGGSPDAHVNVEADIIEPQSGDGGRPIYDAAGCGDPVASDESGRPLPVAFKRFTGEELKVLGKRTFGVRLRGESMSMWEFHAGDTVWIDPDRPARDGQPALAVLRLSNGEWGMAVKRVRRHGAEQYLESDGEDGPGEPLAVDGETVRLVGPVVQHDPAARVPRRLNVLAYQAHLVDRVRRREIPKAG